MNLGLETIKECNQMVSSNDGSTTSGPVQDGASSVRNLLGSWWWIFPFLVLLVGFSIPEMREPVRFTWPLSNRLLLGIIAELILCAGWFATAFWHATNSNITVSELKKDAFVSYIVSVALFGWAIYGVATGNLMWGLLVPTITAMADSVMSTDRSINNAAQKPIVQQQNIGR